MLMPGQKGKVIVAHFPQDVKGILARKRQRLTAKGLKRPLRPEAVSVSPLSLRPHGRLRVWRSSPMIQIRTGQPATQRLSSPPTICRSFADNGSARGASQRDETGRRVRLPDMRNGGAGAPGGGLRRASAASQTTDRQPKGELGPGSRDLDRELVGSAVGQPSCPVDVALAGGDVRVAHRLLDAERACAPQRRQRPEGVAQPVGGTGACRCLLPALP